MYNQLPEHGPEHQMLVNSLVTYLRNAGYTDVHYTPVSDCIITGSVAIYVFDNTWAVNRNVDEWKNLERKAAHFLIPRAVIAYSTKRTRADLGSLLNGLHTNSYQDHFVVSTTFDQLSQAVRQYSLHLCAKDVVAALDREDFSKHQFIETQRLVLTPFVGVYIFDPHRDLQQNIDEVQHLGVEHNIPIIGYGYPISPLDLELPFVYASTVHEIREHLTLASPDITADQVAHYLRLRGHHSVWVNTEANLVRTADVDIYVFQGDMATADREKVMHDLAGRNPRRQVICFGRTSWSMLTRRTRYNNLTLYEFDRSVRARTLDKRKIVDYLIQQGIDVFGFIRLEKDETVELLQTACAYVYIYDPWKSPSQNLEALRKVKTSRILPSTSSENVPIVLFGFPDVSQERWMFPEAESVRRENRATLPELKEVLQKLAQQLLTRDQDFNLSRHTVPLHLKDLAKKILGQHQASRFAIIDIAPDAILAGGYIVYFPRQISFSSELRVHDIQRILALRSRPSNGVIVCGHIPRSIGRRLGLMQADSLASLGKIIFPLRGRIRLGINEIDDCYYPGERQVHERFAAGEILDIYDRDQELRELRRRDEKQGLSAVLRDAEASQARGALRRHELIRSATMHVQRFVTKLREQKFARQLLEIASCENDSDVININCMTNKIYVGPSNDFKFRTQPDNNDELWLSTYFREVFGINSVIEAARDYVVLRTVTLCDLDWIAPANAERRVTEVRRRALASGTGLMVGHFSSFTRHSGVGSLLQRQFNSLFSHRDRKNIDRLSRLSASEIDYSPASVQARNVAASFIRLFSTWYGNWLTSVMLEHSPHTFGIYSVVEFIATSILLLLEGNFASKLTRIILETGKSADINPKLKDDRDPRNKIRRLFSPTLAAALGAGLGDLLAIFLGRATSFFPAVDARTYMLTMVISLLEAAFWSVWLLIIGIPMLAVKILESRESNRRRQRVFSPLRDAVMQQEEKSERETIPLSLQTMQAPQQRHR